MIFRKWWNIIIVSQTLCIFSCTWEKKEISGNWREKQVQEGVSERWRRANTVRGPWLCVRRSIQLLHTDQADCKDRQTRESQWAWTRDQNDASRSQEPTDTKDRSPLSSESTASWHHDFGHLYSSPVQEHSLLAKSQVDGGGLCSGFTKHYQIIPLQNSNCVWGSVTCPRVCPYIQW